jgi:hypothetical protein
MRLPPLCFDLALLVLTVCKIVPGRRGWRRVPVLWLLLRDNSWAFIVVFGKSFLLYDVFRGISLTATYCIGVFCLDGVFFLAVDGPVGAAVWTYVSLFAIPIKLYLTFLPGGSSPLHRSRHVESYSTCTATHLRLLVPQRT